MSKKVLARPTYRSDSGRYLDIPLLIADARKAGGKWLLAYAAAPRATYVAIQGQRHRDLQALTDGTLEAQMRNEHIEDGQRRVDVWVRFVREEP